MAKGNLFLGTAAGKIGDVVMYRYEGKQCSRVRVREIKNPKSEAQQAQRAILSTVTNAYSFLQSICNHSWENVQYEGKSMNYFNKINLKTVRNLVAQSQNVNAWTIAQVNGTDTTDEPVVLLNAPSTTAFIPNNYRISKGSLASKVQVIVSGEASDGTTLNVPFIQFVHDADSSSTTMYDFLVNNGLSDPKSLLTCLYSTTTEQILYATTDSTGRMRTIYGQELNVWRLFRNDFDIDSFYNLTQDEVADTYSDSTYIDLWAYLHATTDSETVADWDNTNEDAIAALQIIFDMNVTGEDVLETFLSCMSNNLGRMGVVLSQSVEDGASTTPSQYVTGCGVIRSLYDGDKWKRSTENFYLYAAPSTDYLGLSPAISLNAWYDGTQSIGDSDYTLDGSSE